MGKLIYAINLSIDGCFDHTKMLPSEEIHGYFGQLIRDADLLVYGRVTYELMVPFEAGYRKKSFYVKNIQRFCGCIRPPLRKLFFQKRWSALTTKKSRIVRGDLKDQIIKLKRKPGNILVGGVDLPAQLIALDLVDEFSIRRSPGHSGRRQTVDGRGFPTSGQNLNACRHDRRELRARCPSLCEIRLDSKNNVSFFPLI